MTSVGEIASAIEYGFTESATNVAVGPKFLRITDIQNGHVDWSSVPYCKCDNFSKYQLKKYDIVFARTGATTGKSFIINECPDAVFASYLIRLRVKDNVLAKYVYYFFQSRSYWNQIKQGVTGSTQGGFNASKLSELNIPIVPLKVQNKIVTQLDVTVFSLEKRKAANALTDQFLQSTFLSIFGDPFSNEKNWKTEKLENVSIINPRMNEERELPDEYEVSFIPMASVSDIDGKIVTSEPRAIKDVKKGFTFFKEKDVLFAKITPCMENGKAAIANELKNGIGFGSTEFHVIRCSEMILPEYIFSIIRMPRFREQAERNMTGSAGQKRVPTTFLKEFGVPIPPVSLQKKFASIVANTEQLRQKQKQSEMELENLFQSLLQKYFS